MTSDDSATMAPGLRERRRRTTVAEIGTAALDLFERQGVTATTVGDIARAADISERTFFRYFSSKEEAVLDFQHWFDAPTRAWLASGPSGHDLVGELAEVCAGVLRDLDGPQRDAADRLRRIRSLMKTEPSLLAVSAMLDHAQARALADRIVDALGPRVSLLEARIAAELTGMALRAACEHWSTSVEHGEPATLEEAYALVRGTVRALASPPDAD
jgi:AcrR family transcriptional regulator